MKHPGKRRSMMIFCLGMVALILGTAMIYPVASDFGMPGIKYILMTPILAIVAYMMTYMLDIRFQFTKMGLIFGLIMSVVNIYMVAAIVSSGVLTDLCLYLVKSKQTRPYSAGIIYPVLCVTSSLFIAKYFIGGKFAQITLTLMLMAALVTVFISFIGIYMGRELVGFIGPKAVKKIER